MTEVPDMKRERLYARVKQMDAKESGTRLRTRSTKKHVRVAFGECAGRVHAGRGNAVTISRKCSV